MRGKHLASGSVRCRRRNGQQHRYATIPVLAAKQVHRLDLHPRTGVAALVAHISEFCGQDHLVSAVLDGASDQPLVFATAVHVCRARAIAWRPASMAQFVQFQPPRWGLAGDRVGDLEHDKSRASCPSAARLCVRLGPNQCKPTSRVPKQPWIVKPNDADLTQVLRGQPFNAPNSCHDKWHGPLVVPFVC